MAWTKQPFPELVNAVKTLRDVLVAYEAKAAVATATKVKNATTAVSFAATLKAPERKRDAAV